MKFVMQRYSARIFLGLLALGLTSVVFLLVLFAPPDGEERGEWLQFLGHFHPLAVHLPIALLILVPVMELAGRSRYFPQVLSSVDFLLGVAMFGAIGAAGLGWCLARSGSYSGSLVTQHIWGGVSVACASWLCWVLRAQGGRQFLGTAYAIVLVATVGLVSFTGYRGGQLSQGENHLTEHMPGSLRKLFGLPAVVAVHSSSTAGGSATFYGTRIQTIFAEHCISCHGPEKHKANLRLDSYKAVIRGSKHGPVIKAGNPQGSELFRRITLQRGDDDLMPKENKPPLSPNEVKRIELWISEGASGTQLAESIKDITGDSPGPTSVKEIEFEKWDPAAAGKQRSGLAAVVEQLQKQFPYVLDYESRGSADLVINASLLGQRFGDDELAVFAPVRGAIVVADFSGTAISDRSSSIIASMMRLRSLRLMHAKVTNVTVSALGSLSQLESLNLFDTAVTADALAAISHLPKLRHIYVHETKISPESPVAEELKRKLVF